MWRRCPRTEPWGTPVELVGRLKSTQGQRPIAPGKPWSGLGSGCSGWWGRSVLLSWQTADKSSLAKGARRRCC